VAGTFKSTAEAKKWVDQNEPPDFFWEIYKFKEGFSPSAGPFPTKDAAEITLIGIRNAFNPSAYLINLDVTCEAAKNSEDKQFITCSERKKFLLVEILQLVSRIFYDRITASGHTN